MHINTLPLEAFIAVFQLYVQTADQVRKTLFTGTGFTLAGSTQPTDWSTGSVTGWSMGYHSHCLCLGRPPSPSLPPPADLSSVSEAYHDLSGIFFKQQASTQSSIELN